MSDAYEPDDDQLSDKEYIAAAEERIARRAVEVEKAYQEGRLHEIKAPTVAEQFRQIAERRRRRPLDPPA